MSDIINNCDCFIGFISDSRVYKSDINQILEETSQLQHSLEKHGLMNGKSLSPKELADNRRGYLSRFRFCPYCGEKINWKNILNDVK